MRDSLANHAQVSMQGLPHVDLVWRGRRSDIKDRGRCGEIHARTPQGPFFTKKINKMACLFSLMGMAETKKVPRLALNIIVLFTLT
jgi:hypothetical protein